MHLEENASNLSEDHGGISPRASRSNQHQEDAPWSALNRRIPTIPGQFRERIDQELGLDAGSARYISDTDLGLVDSSGFSGSLGPTSNSIDEQGFNFSELSPSIARSHNDTLDYQWTSDKPTTPKFENGITLLQSPDNTVQPDKGDSMHQTDFWSTYTSDSCRCERCHNVFTGPHCQGNMRRHMRSHNCGPLVGLRCPYPGCDRTFKRSDSLLNHCRKHHPEVDGAPAPGRTQYFDKRNNESKPGARHDEACGFSDTGDAAFVDSGNSRRPSESTLAQSPKISHRDHGNYTSPNGSDPAIQSIKTIEILSSKTLGHSTNPSSVYTNVPEVIIDSLQDVNDVTTYTQANSPPFPSRIPLTAPRDHGELLQGGGRTTTSTTSHENQTESKESGINDGFSGTAPELDESSRFALEDMEVMPHEARQAIIEQAIKRFLDWFSQIDMRVLRPEEIVQHSVESVSGCIDGCMSDHNEEMGSSASGSGGKISDWKQSTQPLSNTLRKRKVGDSGNGSDDNNDEDDQNKRRIPDSKTRPFSKIVSRFACPFFKRNPERQIRSSCFSLGFQNVTRVKQHIYRTHVKTLLCPRCSATVGDHQGLLKHLGIEGLCDRANYRSIVMENDSQDKIDQDKVDEIRKPSQRGLTEPEKWATLYRLIFDLDADAETPSPYYEHPSTHQSSATNSDSSRDSSWRERYTERLPLIMQNLITRAVEEETRLLRENLNAQIPDFLQTAHRLCVQEVEENMRSNVSLESRSQSSSSREPPHLRSDADSFHRPHSIATLSTTGLTPPNGSVSLSQTSHPLRYIGSIRDPEYHPTPSSTEVLGPMGRPVSQQILIRDPSEGSSFSEPNVAAQLRGHSPVAISCDGSPSTHGQWNGGIADQIIPLEANIPNHVQNSIDQIPPKASVPNATLEDINHDWAWDGMDALTHTLSLTPPLLVSALFDQSNAPPESDAQLNSDSNSSNEQDRPLTGGNDSNALFNAEEEGSLWEPFVDLPFELPKSPDWFSSPGEL